jgi:nicotinate-nucleotide adenylyltransferase
MVHQMICLYLLEAEGFDRVWMVPCYRHAFEKDLVSFEHRVAMCSLSARIFGGRLVVSEVEKNLQDGQVNRSIDTLEYLRAHHPEDQFTLVVGSDIVPELPAWKEFERLQKEFPILIVKRFGHQFAEEPFTVSKLTFSLLSSSEIRGRLAAGKEVTGLVPGVVQDYIRTHSLYRD